MVGRISTIDCDDTFGCRRAKKHRLVCHSDVIKLVSVRGVACRFAHHENEGVRLSKSLVDKERGSSGICGKIDKASRSKQRFGGTEQSSLI